MRISLHHAFPVVVLLLAGASTFFTVKVASLKRELGASSTAQLRSGQAAVLTAVLDGDEVALRSGAETFRVRILGIHAFDPTHADPVEQEAGRAAVRFLETYLERSVKVVFDELKVDSRKRFLAYVELDGTDLGEALISRGLAMAYTKYPVLRTNAYLVAEERASRSGAGLWADPRIANRATQLKALWETQRRRGD